MEQKTISIFSHSGDYAKFYNMLSIAMASISNGMHAHIFFSYEALNRLKKDNINKLTFETNNNFEQYFSEAINENKIQTIEQMINILKETNSVKFYVCSASLSIMKINIDELIEIDKIMGLTTFLNIAEKSSTVLYI
jgi:peroxiredoxin family protein|tara:strand:- start:315 stop:725 length:411 start_codon:yes stop_codon:yes gene_type:complete